MPGYKGRHYCYLTLIEPFVTVTEVIIVVPSCSLLIPLGLHATGRGEFHLRAALNREEFKNNDCFSFLTTAGPPITDASPWNQLSRYVTRRKQTERETGTKSNTAEDDGADSEEKDFLLEDISEPELAYIRLRKKLNQSLFSTSTCTEK